jgi:hypothetical protein
MRLHDLKIPFKVWKHKTKKIKAVQEVSWIDRIIILDNNELVLEEHNTNSFKPELKDYALEK